MRERLPRREGCYRVDHHASFRQSTARLARSAGPEVETFSSASDYLASDGGRLALVGRHEVTRR